MPGIQQVIVKFSPPYDTAIGRRVADLLICEHLASQVLIKHHQQAADSTVLNCDNKIFLELKRFDRGDTFARRGLISLGSLDAEYAGISGTWTQTAAALIKLKVLPNSFYEKIRWLELFGALISNTDMHLYNLSFFTKGFEVVELAPIYDMLPMSFMPRNNQIIKTEFLPPLPTPEDAKIWKSVYSAACAFWQVVIKDSRISNDFKKIAQQCFHKLTALKDIEKLLPK